MISSVSSISLSKLAEAPVSTAVKTVETNSVPSAGFGFQWSKTYGPGFVPPVVNVEAVSPVSKVTTEKIETVQTTGKQDGSVQNVPARFGFQWSKTYGIAPPVFNLESSVSAVAPSTEKPKVEESSTTQTINNVQSFPVGGFGFHYAKAFGPGYYRPPVYRYRYKSYSAPRPSVGFNYSVSKTASPALFNSIFNIPIAALSAVNQLVNGIGVSGSVTKQVSVN